MIEAITRLIPGVLGNPDSLAEESHNEEGYLEYPNYTKPQNWRDISVPEILLSGNHGEIAKWRVAQAIERAKENL
jgi:tRNA (guanine37-N1)-methyltransferase